MTNLVQWDPFVELQSSMDKLFDQGFARPWRLLPSSQYQASIPVEVWETPNDIEVRALLPGSSPDEVQITVANDVLSISTERKDYPQEGRQYYRREFPYGTFSRSIGLPVEVDADHAEARFEHGILHLRLPKAEAARPKQIRVHAGNGASNASNA
jgi:HSP20 family protein